LTTNRPRFRAIAQRLYPRALWIHGQGRYASLAVCSGLTVMLYATMEDARQGKQWIDRCGCGHACRGESRPAMHTIVELPEA
jgi:hypothetical protein